MLRWEIWNLLLVCYITVAILLPPCLTFFCVFGQCLGSNWFTLTMDGLLFLSIGFLVAIVLLYVLFCCSNLNDGTEVKDEEHSLLPIQRQSSITIPTVSIIQVQDTIDVQI